MSHSIEIRRTYKYRLYRNDKRDHALHQQINIAGVIWNHALKLQKRYYRLTGKYSSESQMKSHLAYLRMRTQRYAWWKKVGSQSVQDVAERLDNAYQRFFQRLAKHPPKYKKVRERKSFTLKQAGWKLRVYNQNQPRPNGKFTRERGVIEISGVAYKFVQHRPMNGVIKTVTVKRDAVGSLWLCFSVIEQWVLPEVATPLQMAGFDFGLKTFLTDHTGSEYTSGLHHLSALKRLRKLQKCKDKKAHGSKNRRKAARLIARTHIRVADKRRDEHFKLAHALCDQYDVLCFEDLNLDGMKRLWGRKVSDLAFKRFLSILKHVALMQGKQVVQIGRFERTTCKCSGCQHQQSIGLKERIFCCANCGMVIGRDHNAALNILYVGASTYTGLGIVSPASAGSPV
jgi:putative transposase